MPPIRFVSALSLALLSSSAFSADLPSRKAPPAAPQMAIDSPFSWAGAYVGGEVGLGLLSDKGYATATYSGMFLGSAVPKGSGNLGRSLVGGVYAGHNWQSGQFVFGAEGDLEATTLRASTNSFNTVLFGPISPGVAITSTTIPVQGSLRLRAGLAVNKMLIYMTTGAALAQFKSNYSTLSLLLPGSNSVSGQHFGWTVGAGAEYAFSKNWVARAEYRYTDFGHTKDFNPGKDVTSINGFWAGDTAHHHVNENTLRFGMAYKFN